LYVANDFDPRLKLKYVKFCFDELYDYDKAQLVTKKVKDNLVSLYEFYLKADEVVDDNRHKQDVNDAINDIEVDVNTLARFQRHLQEEDSMENRNEITCSGYSYIHSGFRISLSIGGRILDQF